MMCNTNVIHNSNHQIANHSTTILQDWNGYFLPPTGGNAMVFCLFVCLFVCLFAFIYLFVVVACLFVFCLFVCLFVCTS